MSSINAATWNLAYRNRRMRRSLLRAVIEFACSPAMSHYPPAGFWSLAVSQVGDVLSGSSKTAPKALDAVQTRDLANMQTLDCPQAPEVDHGKDLRDAA